MSNISAETIYSDQEKRNKIQHNNLDWKRFRFEIPRILRTVIWRNSIEPRQWRRDSKRQVYQSKYML